MKMLDVYATFAEKWMAMPVLKEQNLRTKDLPVPLILTALKH